MKNNVGKIYIETILKNKIKKNILRIKSEKKYSRKIFLEYRCEKIR
nr:MAG TPA: hypothetical protein [Caudoviricetes sp.]